MSVIQTLQLVVNWLMLCWLYLLPLYCKTDYYEFNLNISTQLPACNQCYTLASTLTSVALMEIDIN